MKTRPSDSASSPFFSRTGPVFFLTGIFFLNFVSRIILAPLLPAMEKDMGLSHGEGGSFFLYISIGYFAGLVASGVISARLKHRNTITLSAVAVGLALMGIGLSNGLYAVRLELLLVGAAAGLYLPSGIATLTSLIDPGHWGKAIAVHELAPNLAFIAAPLISEALLEWFSWRGVLVFLGGISLLTGAAFARFGRGGDFPGESPGFSACRGLFREKRFRVMVVLFSLGIAGTLGIYTMLPLFLVSFRGMEREWANTLIALSRIPGPVMALLAGWASDRLGTGRTMGGVFLFTGLLTILLGTVPDSWVVALVFAQPVIAVCFFPPGFAALSSIGPAGSRNVVIAFTVPMAFVLGGGLIPTGIGVMGDAGAFPLGIACVGVLILAGALPAVRTAWTPPQD